MIYPDYWKDPILNYVTNSSVRNTLFGLSKKVNQSLGKKSFIETQWSDGIDYNKLKKLKQNRTVLLTNNIIHDIEEYQENIHTANESYYGMFYCPYNLDPFTSTTKDFNCLSNRFDFFRQSWFYHLVRRNWLDRGHVSFNCDIRFKLPGASFQGLTAQEIFEKGFQESNQIFLQEHNKIKDQIPYRNFSDNGDLTNIILTSKFSIILETWFHDNRAITFSEKTMRCLQLPRPWVLLTTQYGIQQLRNWGFDVLDDIVDHRYDTMADSIQRQLAILDVAEKLIGLDINQIALRCQQASIHNQSILKNWNNVWYINISNDHKIAQQKALTLQ